MWATAILCGTEGIEFGHELHVANRDAEIEYAGPGGYAFQAHFDDRDRLWCGLHFD